MNAARSLRSIRWLALGLLGCSALAGCASTPPAPRLTVERAVTDLAERLVREAERRTDVHAIRAYLHAMRQPGVPTAAHDPLAAELTHELTYALSQRVHLIAGDLLPGQAPRLGAESSESVAEHYEVTHFLIGDYVPRAEGVLVSVQLVHSETLLIEAAARGTVPYAELTERSRAALQTRRFGPGPARELPLAVAGQPTLAADLPAPMDPGASAPASAAAGGPQAEPCTDALSSAGRAPASAARQGPSAYRLRFQEGAPR